MSKFWEDIVKILRDAAHEYGSIRKLAETAQMNPSTVSKWLAADSAKSQRSPNVREVGQIMDILGARVALSPLPKIEKATLTETKLLSGEIERLLEEKERLQLELEKERAVSARLQEILQSMAMAKNILPQELSFLPVEDKTKTITRHSGMEDKNFKRIGGCVVLQKSGQLPKYETLLCPECKKPLTANEDTYFCPICRYSTNKRQTDEAITRDKARYGVR